MKVRRGGGGGEGKRERTEGISKRGRGESKEAESAEMATKSNVAHHGNSPIPHFLHLQHPGLGPRHPGLGLRLPAVSVNILFLCVSLYFVHSYPSTKPPSFNYLQSPSHDSAPYTQTPRRDLIMVQKMPES